MFGNNNMREESKRELAEYQITNKTSAGLTAGGMEMLNIIQKINSSFTAQGRMPEKMQDQTVLDN